jgi:hypothetical protein
MASVPPATLDKVKKSFPTLSAWLDRPEFRERLGIGQGDEWPVLFAGYVLNSLARQADEIRKVPFAPVEGDEYFPSQPIP